MPPKPLATLAAVCVLLPLLFVAFVRAGETILFSDTFNGSSGIAFGDISLTQATGMIPESSVIALGGSLDADPSAPRLIFHGCNAVLFA